MLTIYFLIIVLPIYCWYNVQKTLINIEAKTFKQCLSVTPEKQELKSYCKAGSLLDMKYANI